MFGRGADSWQDLSGRGISTTHDITNVWGSPRPLGIGRSVSRRPVTVPVRKLEFVGERQTFAFAQAIGRLLLGR